MTFEEAYEHLNPEQKEAVDHIEGPTMVLAGPGTGKTQMIALRIAQILKKTQASPHNILCLSFTEVGAVAMRKRLIEIIGETAYGVRIHTFHSFCNEVIQDFPTEFLFARELALLTELERIQIFRELLDELSPNSPLSPFGDSYFYLKDIDRAIKDLKRENLSPEALNREVEALQKTMEEHQEAISAFVAINGGQLKEEEFEAIKAGLGGTIFASALQGDSTDKKQRTAMKGELKAALELWQKELPKQRVLVELYTAYQNLLRGRGRYDFEDMIAFVIAKFKENPSLLAHYQEQFQYILVDEYQDTNSAQNEVVRMLGDFFESPNIFVVGDDKQSIYRFQGASLENLLLFYNLYKKNIQVVSLRENYRSQQTVLDAAQSLIRHSEQSLAGLLQEKSETLHANAPHPAELVRVAELETPASERYFLAREVEALIQAGTAPQEIAILYRNNREAEDLADLFLRMKIPFQINSGRDLLTDKEIQKLLMLLRFVANLEDESQLFTILHFDLWNFDSLDIAKLSRQAYSSRTSFLEIMRASPVFSAFTEQLLNWNKKSFNLTLLEFFDLMLKESRFLDAILKKENQLEHLNRLNTLFDELKQWNAAHPQMLLADFIAYLDLLKENGLIIKEKELITQKNAVRLMTAHGSKGLEFERVFIMNFTDKHWGNLSSRSKLKLPPTLLKIPASSEKDEEERRLFFVALTRAKKSVTLSYPKTNAQGRPVLPSLFLHEIDPVFKQNIATAEVEDLALSHLKTLFLSPKPDHSEDHKNYIKSLVQNFVLSVTHLNNYLRCPRLFYYNTVLRVPSIKNKHAAFGTAIHEALKDLLVEVKKGEAPSKEFMVKQFQKHLEREILSKQDFKSCLELGQKTLGEYYDFYRDSFHPAVLLEYDFRPHGVHLNGIPITGKVDKIELKEGSEHPAHIVDYKTGNPDRKKEELGPQGEYRRQIIFYKLLCDNSKKFPYSMKSGEIDFVQKNKAGEFVRSTILVTPQEEEDLKTLITSVYQDIQDLRFLNTDDFEVCGKCEWCVRELS
ncbi:MAG: UvrD-helicase domain-containing protein [Candidatus Gracilibacteria bacterium]|jgi:DNA helicase-2/ATP-dependent DNA helicase PcrA